MTGTNLTPSVPKGPATITGYGTAAVAIVGMVLAYIFPQGDSQTLGVISAGIVALVSLTVTSLGRYAQAKEAIRSQRYVRGPSLDEHKQVITPGIEARLEDLEHRVTGHDGSIAALAKVNAKPAPRSRAAKKP